jgi:hypothetical protein
MGFRNLLLITFIVNTGGALTQKNNDKVKNFLTSLYHLLFAYRKVIIV